MNKTKSLFRLQCGGGCSGDTLSILNMDDLNFFSQFKQMGRDVLCHPLLSILSAKEQAQKIDDILNDRVQMDFFCLEGNVPMGLDRAGLFDSIWQVI